MHGLCNFTSVRDLGPVDMCSITLHCVTHCCASQRISLKRTVKTVMHSVIDFTFVAVKYESAEQDSLFIFIVDSMQSKPNKKIRRLNQ